MKAKKNAKGGTIIEVLVALAITGACAALSCFIYLNLQRSEPAFLRLKAAELAEAQMQETIETHAWFDAVFHNRGFQINRVVSRHPVFTDCALIKVLVFSAEKRKLFELQNVVLENK